MVLRDFPDLHLDSKPGRHHDARMRTTVTLEPDVARLLNEQARRTRKSFKDTLNAAVRMGLGRISENRAPKSFIIEARPMHLKAGVDAGRLNSLLDDLEAENFLAKTHTAGRKKARS